MAGANESSRAPCVIALLPAGSTVLTTGGSAARLHLDGSGGENGSWRLVRADSAYEAAAELLSRPVSALLVDLARLAAKHTSLLKLAAELNIPVVAFGTISGALDGSALAGVHLVGAEQAAETLGNLVAAENADRSQPPAGTPAQREQDALLKD